MRHPEPQKLQRLVDGELSRRMTRKVSAHLENCAECAQQVERVRSTGDLLRFAVDDIIANAPLEGLTDHVMATIENDQQKLGFTEKLRSWLGEFVRYRRKMWAPPLALAGAAAAAILVVILVGEEVPNNEIPQGSKVISISFGSSVDGTVFELEEKDGSTTTVIWVNESKAPIGDSEVIRNRYNFDPIAIKQKSRSSHERVVAAFDGYWRGAVGAKLI